MSFLMEYGLYLAKTATLVVSILITLIGIMALSQKNKGKNLGKLSLRLLNEQYEETRNYLQEQMSKAQTPKKEKTKKQKKITKSAKHNLFVVEFKGDIKASAVANLREEITGILLVAKPQDQVLVRLESPGGSVPGYGLAASQLQRLKQAKLHLTIAVDIVAASGGYMMASVADHLIAAPFAIIGSIGVVMQLPNFHRFLEKKSIDFEQITAGEFKRTVSVFGENTKEGRNKAKAELEEIHTLFKQHIEKHRPQLDLPTVATGEYWCAEQALTLKLIDGLQTSDDFLLVAKDQFNVYLVEYMQKKSLAKRLSTGVNSALTKFYSPVSL